MVALSLSLVAPSPSPPCPRPRAHAAIPTSTHPAHLQGPEELFETVSQALLSGQDRDCLAGWGAVVYVM